MISIEKKFISYARSDDGLLISHFMLIHKGAVKNTLLSHANLYLYSKTRNSKKTSSRYASVISMFYRYLSTLDEFAKCEPSTYHTRVLNKHIRRWQDSREIARVKQDKTRPSSVTIFEDAVQLMNYFRWLSDSNFPIAINIKLKTWIPHYKSARYQEYISVKAKDVIDSTSIRTLDRANRARSFDGLITPYEVNALAENYSDPVYSTLLMLALGTAMRAMDVCGYPYYGNAENSHIMPYSSMSFDGNTVLYKIFNSKGRKDRTIIIHKDTLKMIDESYTTPLYPERAKKYERKYGTRPPLSILFLTKDGDPVTPDRIAQRTTAAKNKARLKDPTLRASLTFHDARDWWPTHYLIEAFGNKLLNSNETLFNYAVAQILLGQMGHGSIETTFKHYIAKATLLLSLYKGRGLELVSATNLSATVFLNRLKDIDAESSYDA